VEFDQNSLKLWRQEFNVQRPREALGMQCPNELYEQSIRQYRGGSNWTIHERRTPNGERRTPNGKRSFNRTNNESDAGNAFDNSRCSSNDDNSTGDNNTCDDSNNIPHRDSSTHCRSRGRLRN
jgi:hypothetical protein